MQHNCADVTKRTQGPEVLGDSQKASKRKNKMVPARGKTTLLIWENACWTKGITTQSSKSYMFSSEHVHPDVHQALNQKANRARLDLVVRHPELLVFPNLYICMQSAKALSLDLEGRKEDRAVGKSLKRSVSVTLILHVPMIPFCMGSLTSRCFSNVAKPFSLCHVF